MREKKTRRIGSYLSVILSYLWENSKKKKGAAIEAEHQTENFTVFQNYNKISEAILDK